MDARERHFAVTMSVAHGIQHFFRRLLPPLIPIWGVAFGYPLWKLGLLFGVMSLGSALGQAPLGVLSDRHDRKHILSIGVGTIGVSYIVFAAAPHLALGLQGQVAGYTVDDQFVIMLLSVFVAGIGSATTHPTGYPLITANVREDHKGKALGMWGGMAKFGDGLAPATVGALLLVLPWEVILSGLAVLAIGYAFVLFSALGRYETHPDDRDDAADAGGVNVLRADPRLYIYPIALIFVFYAIRGIGANGVHVFIPEFVTSVYGYSFTILGVEVDPESTASFYYSALLLAAGVVQLGTGGLVDRYDARIVILGFLGVATATLAVLSVVTLSPAALFVILLAFGATMWGMSPARDALISEITPESHEGRTFGYLWTGLGLFSAISPVIVGYIGDVAGLRQAFGMLTVTLVVSAIPVLVLFSDRAYLPLDRWKETRAAD